MKKKIVCSVSVLLVVLSMCFGISAATYEKMYALDGRTKTVSAEEVVAYENVGWYWGEPQKMHALDGRTMYVGMNRVEEYENVGWYWGEPQKMYALDGRTMYVGINRVEAYENVGWYWGKPTTMYALDGRTLVVGENRIAAYENVGWYRYINVTVYALDGRYISIPSTEVDAYRAVGWYQYPEYACKKADSLLYSFGHQKAVEFLEDAVSKSDDYTIQNKLNEVFDDWYRKHGCPIVVLANRVDKNDMGYPMPIFGIVNISNKKIVSLEIVYTCYDSNGNVTTDYPSLYNGSVKCTGSVTIDAHKSDIISSSGLSSNKKTTSVKNIYVSKVTFADGTTWYR